MFDEKNFIRVSLNRPFGLLFIEVFNGSTE